MLVLVVLLLGGSKEDEKLMTLRGVSWRRLEEKWYVKTLENGDEEDGEGGKQFKKSRR